MAGRFIISLVICTTALILMLANVSLAQKNVTLKDEFGVGGQTSGTIGELGWSLFNIGTSSTSVAPNFGVFPHLGQNRIESVVNGGGSGACLTLGRIQGPGFHEGYHLNADWEYLFIFKLGDTSNARIRIGLAPICTSAEPYNGMWLRYDVSAGFSDTTFKVETKAAASTVSDTGISPTGLFHTLRIFSKNPGAIVFELDGEVLQPITTNIPSDAVQPVFIIASDGVAGLLLYTDYFEMKAKVAR